MYSTVVGYLGMRTKFSLNYRLVFVLFIISVIFANLFVKFAKLVPVLNTR